MKESVSVLSVMRTESIRRRKHIESHCCKTAPLSVSYAVRHTRYEVLIVFTVSSC